jgi:hypothetical protein
MTAAGAGYFGLSLSSGRVLLRPATTRRSASC